MKNNNSKKKEKRIIIRNNLPIRIIVLTTLAALVGIVGIIMLLIEINLTSADYKTMISNDYINIQYMDEISQQLYLHQALIYKYINSDDANKKEALRADADNLKGYINNILLSFGDNTRATSYESYYHGIYTNATGYFSNIQLMFDFYDAGEFGTAEYYIDLAMEHCIKNVNDSIDNLNKLTQADMERAQSSLYIRLSLARILGISSVSLVLIFSIFCIFYSAKTADEMISVDSLTDVYNYDKLLRFANKMDKKNRLQEYTVISLNIKDFKYINQQNGSAFGDEVLKQFALYIYPHIVRNEIISRIGGDNYVLLVKSPNTDMIINTLSDIKLDVSTDSISKTINIKSRCGIYNIKNNDDISTALNNASIALNKSRISSNSPIIYFSEDMVNEMVAEKEVLSLFSDALRKEEFQVYYQPKVDMPTGKLCGAEALVRWIKDGQVISPAKFIPVLEKDGALTELDFYVFDHVCSDIERWKKEGLSLVKISSNFSKLHLQNKNFSEDVLSIVRRHSIESEYIETELTESSGYDDMNSLKSFIAKMKRSGISTSMDDFGTGYSSLSMLQELDVDVVKLDKSFVDHIGEADDSNKTNSKMVEHVVHMVNDLKKSVICEGIETEDQARFLVKAGCNTAQGYLYNKPLPRDEFEQLLANPVYTLVIS